MTESVEDRLRDVFAERAAAIPPRTDPYERTRQALRRSRRRRRLAAGLTVCVLTAVAVPMAVFTPLRNPPLEDWPVRGSLAGNSQFLEAARAEAVQSMELDGDWDIDHTRIVYAGDRGEHRRVVAVVSATEPDLARAGGRLEGGRDQNGREQDEREHEQRTRNLLLFMRGAFGAEPEDLYARESVLLPGEDVPLYGPSPPNTAHLAYVESRGAGGATVFALGPPDTRAVAYSSRPLFHPDGTRERSWSKIPTRDGVAFGRLRTPPSGASLLRLRLPGDIVAVAPSGRYADSNGRVPDVAGMPREAALAAMSYLSAETGMPADRFDARAVWHAEGERWRSGESWLLAARLPSGATFQTFWGESGGQLASVPRGQGTRPLAFTTRAFPFLRYDAELPPPYMWGALRQPPRVLVVAPGNTDGYVQLLQRGKTLATEPLDETAAAEFSGRVVRRAAQAGGTLRFRVFGGDGQQTHRGTVHTQGVPRWSRTG